MILLKFIERQDLINLTKILKDIEESSTQLDEIILKNSWQLLFTT